MTPPGEMPPFDLTGPLPTGTTLLEASAGTGKTFTVGALVTRYVAQGVARLDEMLVITFGRAASQELRERVRGWLVEAERALGDPSTADPDNAVLGLLLSAPPQEQALYRRRLRDALASFDAATIATTHQFCQLVLRSLGVAGDTDAGATLVDNLDDLVVEVVDDLYLQWFGHVQTPPPFDRTTALALAREVVGDPQARLAQPESDDPAERAGARVRFAQAVRAEIDRRKRRLGLLSYDDLLSRLATALEDDDAPARERMRGRWRIVLVDEFQDTDPVQWQVLDRAFTGHSTMVLIGDPKQAIYAFRGGDVVTYLAAARTAGARATLGTNRRSDRGLVERLQVVLRHAALGDPDIVVRPVDAHHADGRLVGAPSSSPLRLRRVPRDGFKLRRGNIAAGEAREFIARDCAADIARLLAARPTFCGERLQAGDIAVLVAARPHGVLVQQQLRERGIPAVLHGGSDIFTTPAADDWLSLLEALEQPHRSGRVRSAALTCFLGRTTLELDEGGEELTGRIADLFRGWALLLRGRGVAALFEAAEERGLTARILAQVDGERLLTDLRHLAQLLHQQALEDRLGLTGLLAWLREQRRRTSAAERPRRLDSDAAAVQIVTIHGSKGLEYPVTYLPFAYQFFQHDTEYARFHAAAEGGPEGAVPERMLDVSGYGARWDAHLRRHQAEELGEQLRQLYVALTRAQSQVVTWWAPTANTPLGGLHRLLFGRRPGTAEVPDKVDVGDDEYAARVLDAIEELGGPTHEVAVVADVPPVSVEPEHGRLAVRDFGRPVDTQWRRTSYSALIRIEEQAGAAGPSQGGDAGGVGSEPEHPGLEDEADLTVLGPADEAPSTAAGDPGTEVRSPMADLPAGATFGSLVHAVLEHADPDAEDPLAELRSHAEEQLHWWPAGVAPDELAHALLAVTSSPLGPLADDLSLRDIALSDRLRELDFELPLAGGDVRDRHQSRPEVRLRDLAPLLRRHLTQGDPLLDYAERLEQPLLGDQLLRGYLAGSVDAVLRLPADEQGVRRFVVVDYKTNLLGEPGRPLTAADYAPARLREAMLHSHYPLQALLYAVVTHRYLRWRLAGYDPDTHLGGVLYLYLRGMCGSETPTYDGHPAGVFSWRPPGALVVALSDLLDGRAS